MATRANRYRSDLPPLLYPSTLGTDRRWQIDVHDGLNGWKVIFYARSVISRERERVLRRRNWKKEGRVDETIKMRFSLVDGEERRKRARFDLISLNEPQNWLMIILVRRGEEVDVYSDLTCYQLCPCYSSCMPKASLFARVSLSCSPRLASLLSVMFLTSVKLSG